MYYRKIERERIKYHSAADGKGMEHPCQLVYQGPQTEESSL